MSTKKIHMLHICRRIYPSFRVDLSQLFSKEFISKGHKIDWLMQSLDEYNAQEIVVSEQERIILGKTLKAWSLLTKPLNNLITLLLDFKILWLARKQQYDIIQVRDKTFASLIGLLAARITKVKFVYWMSYTFVEADGIEALESWQKKKYHKAIYLWCRSKITGFYLYKIIIPLSDHTFVQSDRMQIHVEKLGEFEGKLTTVPMGVSIADMELNITPIEDARLNGKVPIVYLGTMIAIRKIDFFIEVLAEVIKTEPNAVLILIGDGPKQDMQILRDAVTRLGLEDSVLFTGFIDRLEAWRYVKASRVGLAALPPNPVLDTCSPTKAVEYMALEIPSVVNDIGDQGTIVELSQAGLVADYEPKAFAKAILKITQDEKMAMQMTNNGRPWVFANRTYKYLGDELEAKYFEILGITN